MYEINRINILIKNNDKINKRISIVYFSAIIVLSIIALNIVWIQVFEAKKLEKICETKNQIKLTEIAPRGDIFDKNGKTIATSIVNNVLYIHKTKIHNKENLINTLVSYGISNYNDINKALKSKMNYIPISYDIPDRTIKKLHLLHSNAIIIKKEKLRYYNQSPVFSNLIGFVGMDNHGLEGIEYKYNKLLQGKNGFTVYERKPQGPLYEHPENPALAPVKGKDIYLTIDYELQEIAHNTLKKVVDKLHANYGDVIIMEVKTGKILAMANYPSYNSNLYGKGDVSKCKNYSILSLYEPGSIFKIVPAAAAIEYNILSEDSIVKNENEKKLIINNHTITDAHETGRLTFKEAFVVSSNIAFVHIGEKIGKRLLYVFINAMGFNRKTNIKLPGEQKGLLAPEEKWIPIHQANICFGQGILVNSLQMLCAYNIVANGGVYINPTIIDKIDNRKVSKISKKRIMKKHTAEILNDMLINVVKEGTGKKAQVRGITIAGKTGTAEKSKEGKGYTKGKFTSSFVGYFPAEDPQLILIVTLDEPYIYWGSEAAAPLFANIVQRIINLKNYRFLLKKGKNV